MSLDPRRAGRLTASMVGAAIGVNKFCSRQKAWRLAVGQEVFEGNEMTAWGNDHESEACKQYEVETGEIVQQSLGNQIFYTFEDWLGATPDGKTNNFLIEFKCPFSQKIPDEVPPHYMAQVQVGMKITNRLIAHLCYWTPEKLKVFEIKYSDEYWQAVLPLMLEFNQYLKDDVEPKRKKKPILPTTNAGVIIDERN